MNVLSIGNSFSQDAQAYLHGVCSSAGVDVYAVNLYIGGCPLVKHLNNIKGNLADYDLEINGKFSGQKISIADALNLAEWDVITLQEASARAVEIAHFEPYISEICRYIKEKCPNAKIALHQTWGYSDELIQTINDLGFKTPMDMFGAVEENYKKIAKEIKADMIIPSGNAIKYLLENGYSSHRDGQHASLGAGRYALALTWLKALFGISPIGNSFRGFAVEMTEDEILAAQRAADLAFRN